MEEVPTVKTQQTDPTSLTLPQRKIDNPQKVQGGNRNPKHTQKNSQKPPKKALKTNIHTQSQRNLPNKPKTTKQSKHNKEKTYIENVPSVNWKNRVENRNAVTVTTRILLAENPRASLKNEDTQKVEEKALTGEKHRRKNAK